MTTLRFSVSQVNEFSLIDNESQLGPDGKGNFIHEIFNCPDEVNIEDAAKLLPKALEKNGQYKHNFADLASGGSSCCNSCS